MFSMLYTFIYDCCFGPGKKQEQVTIYTVIRDIQCLSKEDFNKLLRFYIHARNMQNLHDIGG